MKKYLFVMLLIACCVSVNAQVTCNVRVGAGAIGTKYDETGLGFNSIIQCNIPFQRGSQWTFSPSIACGIQLDDDDAMQLYAPLQVGYKVPLGSSLFFPKFGAAVGYEMEGESAIVGPAVSLDFEIKHFIVGMNGFYSIPNGYNKYNQEFHSYGAYLNLGYKF